MPLGQNWHQQGKLVTSFKIILVLNHNARNYDILMLASCYGSSSISFNWYPCGQILSAPRVRKMFIMSCIRGHKYHKAQRFDMWYVAPSSSYQQAFSLYLYRAILVFHTKMMMLAKYMKFMEATLTIMKLSYWKSLDLREGTSATMHIIVLLQMNLCKYDLKMWRKKTLKFEQA